MKISIKSKVADFKLRVSDKQLGINILIICMAVLTSSFQDSRIALQFAR